MELTKPSMQSKKNVFLWVLYDFANSIVSITFFLYFAQWLVIERGVSDFAYNLAFTISAILLLVTVPVTGSMLDKSLRRITGLRWTTYLTVLFYGTCALFALAGSERAALVFFTLGLYCYLLSFTFYTPLINDLAPEQRRGRISGYGIGANYFGQIVGLLIALPFSTGKLSLLGGSPRAETLLPAVIIFFVFALPMLFFFKEPRKEKTRSSLAAHVHSVFAETRFLITSSSVALFLLAYFLFNDAILTAGNNFPIFLEQVWGVSDTIKTFILLGILITSAIGGIVSGFIGDRFGHKKTLVFVLCGYLVIFPLLALLTNFTLLCITTTLFGLWYGATWTVSRSLMSHIAPVGKHNLAFAYFGLAERASSLLGPLVWGGIVTGFLSWGSVRYRIAVIVITGFIVLGLLALMKVKERKTNIPNPFSP
jgi:UMF1 family MFS transporter